MRHCMQTPQPLLQFCYHSQAIIFVEEPDFQINFCFRMKRREKHTQSTG